MLEVLEAHQIKDRHQVINMRIRSVSLEEITYNYTDYSQALYDSVRRISFSFPITIRIEGKRYVCVDGHKRLSVLHDLLLEDPHYKRGDQVKVIIKIMVMNVLTIVQEGEIHIESFRDTCFK